MKLGDLVRYHNDAYPTEHIGIIIEVEFGTPNKLARPYRVRWVGHTESMRDWYTSCELKKV